MRNIQPRRVDSYSSREGELPLLAVPGDTEAPSAELEEHLQERLVKDFLRRWEELSIVSTSMRLSMETPC